MGDPLAGGATDRTDTSTPTAGRPLRIGGMALGNGLMLHSARYWAAAVRDGRGEIQVASGAKRFARAGGEGGIPLVRGLLRLADGLMVVPAVRRSLPAAVLPLEERRVQTAVAASMLAGLGMRSGRGSVVKRELSVLLVSAAPLLFALRGSELAAYHGAEHKSIGEYERDAGGGTGEATKEHERCGSNVVGPLLITSFLSNVAIRSVRRRPGPGSALVSGLLSLGGALEVFRWMSRHPGEPVSRALAWPGRALQASITTREPSEAQMEVARAALAALLDREFSPAGGRAPVHPAG